MGAQRKGQPERGAELRPGVGLTNSTCEAAEGNEAVEGRRQPEGSLLERARVRTLSRVSLLPHLQRVNEAAKRNKQVRFTALLHHVDVAALERAFRLKQNCASAGVDGETVDTYEQGLQAKLVDLC